MEEKLNKDNLDLGKFSHYQNVYKDGEFIRPGPRGRKDHRFKTISWKEFKGKSVLDLGCNNGLLCIEAKRWGATRVVGVDIDPCIPAARQLAEAQNLNIEFWQLDIESKEFRHFCDSFDIIFYCAMHKHMRNKESMINWIDEHCNNTLYFESNSGECHDCQIQCIEKWGSFSIIKKMGESGTETEGQHIMWKCGRGGKENNYPDWRKVPVTFLPADKIEDPDLNDPKWDEFKKSEYYIKLKENIARNGIRHPKIVFKLDPNAPGHGTSLKNGYIWKGLEGGHRTLAAKELGYKELPCRVIYWDEFKSGKILHERTY